MIISDIVVENRQINEEDACFRATGFKKGGWIILCVKCVTCVNSFM
jgi:hypothetical protein